MTILIVDDIAANIQVVGNILKDNGYNINFALSGEAALKHVKENHYDLILLDIMMPDIHGLEVCRRLKDDPATRDIPVIFLTAKTDAASLQEAFQIGAVDYVTKPFMKEELLGRVKTHLEINRQKKELIELNNIKTRFFSIIAHDLRNSIGGLMSYTKMLMSEYDNLSPNRIKKIIENTSSLAGNTYGFLENLLEWAKSQMGVTSYKPENQDLYVVAADVVKLFLLPAKEKEIDIQNNIKQETMVYCDKNMICTVIRNLLSNAVKYSNKGGKIELASRLWENAPGFLEVTVKDNGVGISPEGIKKLFHEESVYTTLGTNKEKGSGLGLLLCRELIVKNGGGISVESEIGSGSSFMFTIPVGK